MHDSTTPEVRVVVDPEEDVVRIIAQGCCIVLTGTKQMRDVRDRLSSCIGLLESEHTGAAHRAVQLHRGGNDGRVTWFDTGSGPGWGVGE